MAKHLSAHWSDFDKKGFIKAASHNLDALELKQRSNQIADALSIYLPSDFEQASDLMLTSLGNELEYDLSVGENDTTGISGWAIMPMSHYVALHGQDHFDLSMTLLKEMTKRSSSEFAIRYFLVATPQKTIKVMKKWAKDKNHHVRRLASEGCRPRLPWGMQLPLYIEDPQPVIDVLELLKDDPEEYVRRSVANNLNDIAKDHPDLVANLAQSWMKNAGTERKKLVKHGCRTLIKQGHKKTLRVLGYTTPKLHRSKVELLTPEVEFGKELKFSVSLQSAAQRKQPLMIDYIIYHQKANGSLSPKVFKWTSKELPANQSLDLAKKHPMKYVTTRVYYPGLHRLEVTINGESIGSKEFHLRMP